MTIHILSLITIRSMSLMFVLYPPVRQVIPQTTSSSYVISTCGLLDFVWLVLKYCYYKGNLFHMKIVDRINRTNRLNADHAKLILRLAVGVLVLLHGIYKLQNPGAMDFIGGAFAAFGLPAALAYLVYVGEIIAPIMLIVGYQTRIAALLIAITMVVAVVLVHLPQLFTLSEMGGGYALELQTMYLAGALAIFGLGAGKYTLTK